ncbi:hypothetical protein QN277_025004 [Acacia crassicarpa]|uniref:Myb-like domain-containing protein n=1 Tax=Acacia crassicarpa TaxID=499986 RepID=A0AAE1JD95_9FABA|nr:hypothetical protein QN277_025004 [Acacia crassicarpa]
MASPPSPKPLSLVATTASLTKKAQSIPWTHQETINLIQAYQDKWYSLKRGPLKANQWEEVAVTVAVRCGYDYNEPSKTAVQCRHKMEKLRQRYRAENHRLAASSSFGSRVWQYFDLMDQLEKGPVPISAQPLVAFMPFDYDDNEEENDDDDSDDYDKYNDIDERRKYSQSRSTDYFLISQRPESRYRGVSEFSREQVAKRLRRVSEEEEENFEEVSGERMVEGIGLVSGLAAEMKAFAERFIGMENLKMEMMKETERCRLEMENKRTEMIVKSQQRIVDSIGKAFGFPKKMKISPEI